VAPAGSEQVSMSPRQTEALLPKVLLPAGQGAQQQDVSGNKQEQSRLVEDIRQTAAKANTYLRLADTHLEFKVSEQTGQVVISVVESDTQEVVRQIPPETLTRFANRTTRMRGLLFEVSG
jgi:flagellar protein FlaG